MPRATGGCGKTDDYRPVDPKKWERGWLRSDRYGFKCPLCNKDGSEKHINDNCKLCKGIGYLAKQWWKVCDNCQGTGVAGIGDFHNKDRACTHHSCLNCNGIGYKEKKGESNAKTG